MTDMQPQNSEQRPSIEQLPVTPPSGGERIPVLPSPESGIETGAERREQVGEAQAAVADAATTAAAPVATAPVDTPRPAPASANPLVAADEDVIEKEWVDRAKKIVMDTKDDPHGRQQQVSELQKDYLQKRYGKQLGAQ